MYEVFRGVCVIEPTPGPIDYEKVTKDLEELNSILKAAKIKLDAEETRGRPKSDVWCVGVNTITADMVKIATKNKIPRSVVHNRIKECGWSVEKAISTPLIHKDKLSYAKKDLEEAENNGIGRCAFVSRVFRGWDVERAKTQPIKKRLSV